MRAEKHLLEEVAVPVQIKGRNGQLSGKPGTNNTFGPMNCEDPKGLGSIDHGAFSQMPLGLGPREALL